METIIRAPIVSSEPRMLHSRDSRAAARAQGLASPPQEHALQPAVPPAPAAPDRDEQQRMEAARQQQEKDIANAFALAEQRGFDSGLARGEQAARAAVDELLGQLASIAAALREAREAVIADAEDLLVEVVYAAVCRIVGEHIVTPEGVAGMTAAMLRSFREGDGPVLRLHPQDARLLRQQSEASGRAVLAGVTVREDPSLDPGGCIVDSSRGSLDARLDVQLAALRGTLLAVRRRQDRGEEAA